MLTVASVAGVVVFRLLGTHTTVGRHFDLSAIQNGLALTNGSLNSSNALLVAISSTSLVLFGSTLVGFTLFRRRYDLAAACAVGIGGSFATTEFLKRALPHRAGVPDYLAQGFPSGHSTIALALGLAYVLVTPRSKRVVAATVAAVAAAAMGVALVFNAWHLPSDVGGGFCVSTAWAAAAAQLVRRPSQQSIPARLLVAIAVVVALAAVGAVHVRPGLDLSVTIHGRLFEAALGIAIAAAVCCAAFAYAIAERSASATRS